MRLNFTTSWIFQGWITYFVLALYAQKTFAKVTQCGLNQYLTKESKCCNKCGPGFRVNIECSGSKQTKCLRCNAGEYQPDWTQEKRCFQQSTCDPGKGFMARPENPLAEEPCRCRSNLQCSLINCEYCEARPTCRPGEGLEPDPESATRRSVCVPCKRGFFSSEHSKEPCKQWTSCKSLGRTELQPAGRESDAECGALSGAPTSWVIVSVLSVITVLSLLILLLFCYKDKLKLLSVNLRSCIQNLKRSRIQQETMGAGAVEAGPGEPHFTACETSKLICPRPGRPACDDTRVSMPGAALTLLPPPERRQEAAAPRRKPDAEEDSERSGEPEEVSDDEGGEEGKGEKKEVEEEEEEEEKEADQAGGGLLVGCCVCVAPVREPLEVGENEDCSQAVSHGTTSACSCGGGQGRGRDEGQRGREEASAAAGKERVDGGENIEGSGKGCLPPSLSQTATPSQGLPYSPLQERCQTQSKTQTQTQSKTQTQTQTQSKTQTQTQTQSKIPTQTQTQTQSKTPTQTLTQTQTNIRSELKLNPSERPQGKRPETNRLLSTDSDSAKPSAPTTAFTPSSPLQNIPVLMSPLSAGELYLEKTREASDPEWSQGVSWGPSAGNKLLSGGLELECPPESLQSQLAEPAPTSGQVTGNHNTTFISSGQVMNFSGDVIVVYVSQPSAGDEEGGGGAAFGSPVQEQADDRLRSGQQRAHHVTPGDSVSHNAYQASTLPVQEVTADWPRGK